MTRYLLIAIYLFSFQIVQGQNNSPKMSLTFENESLKSVLNTIEDNSNFTFYYVEDWLGTSLLSGNYQNVTISHILDFIFKDTYLNYFIFDNSKIILTLNNIIYNDLPVDIFKQNRKENLVKETEKSNFPIFYDNKKITGLNNEGIIRIGKENKESKQKWHTLKGVVKFTKTDEPISNLAIVVKNKKISAVSSKNGYYEINLPSGLNILELSALGIDNIEKSVIIFNDGRLDFNLDESLEMLNEVVIEANREMNVVKPITGVTQIEVSKIKTIPLVLGERDLLKVATTLPGIATAGEGSAGYNVRGGKSDQNLILLDNALIYNPNHFFGIFSALNPFTTGQITIYKGSIPSEFGGRLSSVFELTTKDGNMEKFSGEASIGPVMGNISLEFPIIKKKASLIVGVRSTYSDWVLKLLDEESLKNSEASFSDFTAKYSHNINEDNTLKISGYYSKDAFSITSDSLYNYSNNFYSLKWDHRINKNHSGSLIAANSRYKFNINYKDENANGFDLGYKIDETEVKIKMKYSKNKIHKFIYGLSGKLYNVYSGYINPIGINSKLKPLNIPKERGLESALFVSDNYEINDKLLVSAGLRYSFFAALGPSTQRLYQQNLPKSNTTLIGSENFDKNEVIENYNGLEVRLSSRYFLKPDFSFKLSYNNTYQYIHTLSNNTSVSPTDTWKLSDANIAPQRAEQFSLGFHKDIQNNMYETSIEAYYKKLNNIVDYKVGADLLLNETIETEILQGQGTAYGIEFLIKKTSGKLNGWIGYTYARSWNKFKSNFIEETINNGNKFPANYDKPHDFSLVANYKLTKRYSLSTNIIYQTGRPITYPVGMYTLNNADYVLYSDRNKFRLPDYYRLDLSLNIEGNHKIKKFAHSFWNISVFNVLGRNNPYSVFFVTEKGSLKAYKSSIFSIPIPTITYNFKF